MKTFVLGDRGLPAQIAGEIGRRITLGELKVGEILPKESEFLTSLRVSRTTLREALKILSTKGFIEAKPRLGTRVRSPEFWNTLDPVVLAWQGGADDQDALAEELFEIRSAVEPLAAGLAARRGSAAEYAQIRAAFSHMTEEHATAEAAIEADISFHLQIFQAAHNRFLLPVSSVIRAALTISIPKTLKTFGGLQHSLKMHEAIIDAIEARDETRASEAATLLISATYQRNFSLGGGDTP
ncbi:DNA-binding FadR family transcriptional regulator [Pararhizobium capsulatum DSM 1112]|uniref:DNA-binding FadR family transcriptional regulator n=1 Tax=Pararhizobium capsulatum DSM 1112 TaxID=1121113 RepID=A0ABU0BWK6_9HYPH|nr:FadR/GntR family transcriptional regulator [Pararhizobium capsulatum]MDQ0322337.1 DNA-binding FadR family transcriptional regulator [Pararhizobium capsulatum DSM 1112]